MAASFSVMFVFEGSCIACCCDYYFLMEKAGVEFIIAFYSLVVDVGASVGAISFSCVANLIGSSTEFFCFKSVKERILVSCLQYTKIYAF